MTAGQAVAIIGGGIVGITAGIELLRAGFAVTMYDRDAPGQHASRWNSGVFSTSSLVPLGNPNIFAAIPRLLLRRVPGFRLDPAAMHRSLPWAVRFLAASRAARYEKTVAALHGLICLSRPAHEALLAEAGRSDLMLRHGWLFAFENEAALAGSALLRRAMNEHGVGFEVLDGGALLDLEPHLDARFTRGLWLKESASATDPHLVVQAYLDLFLRRGGRVEKADIRALVRDKDRTGFVDAAGNRTTPDHVVVAAGPWSHELLRTLGLALPMIAERGYMRRFRWQGNKRLLRPVFDVAGGLVASPRPDGLQISTGTELTTVGAQGSDVQVRQAEARAAALFPIDAPLGEFTSANRPSLPDGRPAIGPATNAPGLWLACGHQHIGFNTSAGTARLLAAQVAGTAPDPVAQAFLPARFGL